LHSNSSEFFRANHRDEKVSKEQQRDDADDDDFHMRLELLAEAHVKGADHEKQDYSSAKNNVVHNSLTNYGRWRGSSQKRE
jgi:hypothetical protein